MISQKYKIGIVIGRFQPFHLGHKYVIEKALGYCEKVYVGIGSSQVFNAQNPYSAKKRRVFLKEFIKEEKLEKRIIDVIEIEDYPDDDMWFERLIQRIPGTEVVIGDNEWVNGIFERHNIPALRIGYYKRHILEGTKIRKLIQEKKSISRRIPKYLKQHI